MLNITEKGSVLVSLCQDVKFKKKVKANIKDTVDNFRNTINY